MRQDRNSAYGKERESHAREPGAVWAAGRPDGAVPEPARTAAPTTAQEFLVQFKPGAAASQASTIEAIGGQISNVVRSDASGDLLLVSVANAKATQALAALQRHPLIEFAEANATLTVQGSNEPRYMDGRLWGMLGDETDIVNPFGSQAGEAWAAGHTGKTSTVIGVVDSGIDYTHPDLYLNIWLNPGEVPTNLDLIDTDGDGMITFRDLNHGANAHAVSDINGNGRIDAGDLLKDVRWANGIDLDGNGRIDDLIGWNFVTNTNDPMDGNGHGTHVAGTIGAMGNNGIGVAGVNWTVQMVALKSLPNSGSGTISAAISALDYYTAAAKAHGDGPGNYVATNNSWATGSYSHALLGSVVAGAREDVLFVAAAGNGSGNNIGKDNDLQPTYPANYSTLAAAGWEAVVAVASITKTGGRSGFSNFGALTVDIGAPGSSIISTTPNGGYASYSGTSMAAPHVAGALGLLSSANEGLSGAELRDLLLDTATPTTSMALTVTGGRLNVADMLTAGAIPAEPPPPEEPPPPPEEEPLPPPEEPPPPPEEEPPPPPPPPEDLPNIILGTSDSDVLIGTDGDDIIIGVPSNDPTLGTGTADRMTGGAGNDLFVLGDSRGAFYQDGNNKSNGLIDRAVITDFSEGDRIQLAAGTYFIRYNVGVAGERGTGIFLDTNGNNSWDGWDEMVGLVMGSKIPTFDDFVYVDVIG
ncbi:S8 family serine peptidase [Sandarakinorhabdus sp.]|uniref:S8 family serine peptidase n=1 Tax=Sandarakinorhabdus sp. TaxID=1916663 RepID=UPI003F6FE0F1